MIPAQAQVQALSHAQPLPKAAEAEERTGCYAVAQLQSQIDSLQAQLFQLAVARQVALSPAEHYVGASTPDDINAFRTKQVVRFKEVYERLPDRLAEYLLNDVQQHVTRFIYCQPWEIENLESLKWMLAVESVVSELFPAIPSATSETTTSETPSTCAVSYSLVPCCLTDALQIEAAPLPSPAKSCSVLPSDCSTTDVVPNLDFSCVGAPSDPNASRAAECVYLEGKLADRTRRCRPARRKVSPRFNLRSSRPFMRLGGSHRRRLRPRHRPLLRVCGGFVVDRLSRMSVSVISCPRPRSVVPRHVRLARDLRSRPRCKMRCLRLSPVLARPTKPRSKNLANH